MNEGAVRSIREIVIEKGYLTADEANHPVDVCKMSEGGIQAWPTSLPSLSKLRP